LDLNDQIYPADSINDHLSSIDEKKIEEVWLDEVERRDNEYLEGKATLISGKDFIKYMREKHS